MHQKKTVCKVLNRSKHGKYLVAYVLNKSTTKIGLECKISKLFIIMHCYLDVWKSMVA